ncbi:MAG: AAA family ATPase [Spirochaetes bacterium]|nr:AAA family ATPase [Spirochaetota bacterium]
MNETIETIKHEFQDYFKVRSLTPIQALLDISNSIELLKYMNDSVKLYDDFNKLKIQLNVLMEDTAQHWGRITYADAATELMEIYKNESEILGENFEEELAKPEFKIIYIPILRGLRLINYSKENDTFQDDDFYRIRTEKDYNFENSNYSIKTFTGLTAYEYIKNYLLGDLKKRNLISEYQKYLSENFFDNKPVALIPSGNNGNLTIKIGDEKEQPIYDLGDGIQSIIIITLPLFLFKDENLLVFIEEPEQLLHPGLQRKLISTFNEKFENNHYFMTTHSNHFLDLTLDFSDISIYGLRKDFEDAEGEEKMPTFTIENLSHGGASSLELLGVKNSSVFLSNCTIWVEGITDRLYFRRYLEIYMNHLKENDADYFIEFNEDFHYSYVEYSGNNITHWSFLDNEENPINVERLCGRLFLIADKDKFKDERHDKLKKVLEERFCRLDCVEVENLLTEDVLLKVIEEYERNTLNIDFEEANYKNEPLGKFIDEQLGGTKKRKGSYKTESGTISDKGNFCKKAIKNINNYNDLSDETKEICKRIYKFIKSNNQ